VVGSVGLPPVGGISEVVIQAVVNNCLSMGKISCRPSLVNTINYLLLISMNILSNLLSTGFNLRVKKNNVRIEIAAA